jgi:hypothetical protein
MSATCRSVVDDAIVVTMPGPAYAVTYRKRDEPWLLASDIRDDKNSPISRWTFRAKPGPQPTRRRASLGGLCSFPEVILLLLQFRHQLGLEKCFLCGRSFA